MLLLASLSCQGASDIGLACTCLAIAHDRSVVALHNALHDFIGCKVVHIVLGGVMKDMAEFELPGVVLVVNDFALLLLVHVHLEILNFGQHGTRLTPVCVLIFKLSDANESVGLVLMMTFTGCFDICL